MGSLPVTARLPKLKNMEEKEETNARGRAAKGKIMTEEKYKGGKPGSLDLRVNYDAGCLYVGLGEASLYGKPSQDPYALVYILDPHTGLCKFQIGNNKTKTFDKNIKPNFNSEFQFIINYDELLLKSQCLVVAIWDKDSHSRDDYMAGFRCVFPPRLPARADWRTVSLKHQERDGHPAAASPTDIFQSADTKPGTTPSESGPPSGSSGYPPYPAGTVGTAGGYPATGDRPYPGLTSGTAGGYPPSGGNPYPSGPAGTSGGYPPTGGNPYPGGTAGTARGYPPTGSNPYPSGQGTPYPKTATGSSPYPSGAPASAYPGAKK